MKIAVRLFFLLIFLIPSASFAEEISFQLPADYKSHIVAEAQNATSFTFDYEGNYIFSEDLGKNTFRIVKVGADGQRTNLVERTQQQLTNLSFYQGLVYVITKGQIYRIKKGRLSDVITGLPVYGDYGNTNVIFNNGSMFFGVGTATNSGIVGPDNQWLNTNPSVHDIACGSSKLSGVNITEENFLTKKKKDMATTGSFMPYNTPNSPEQQLLGMNKCNGAILKASPDGVLLSVYAWGLHNPKSISLDTNGHIWVLDGGMEDRGVRPIKDGKDSWYEIAPNTWYGWPDFSAGTQISQSPILAQFPGTPPKPAATFGPNQFRNLIIAPNRFAIDTAIGQTEDGKLSSFDGEIHDFASINGKILQFKFGPDDKLYALVNEKETTKLYVIEPLNVPKVASTIAVSRRSLLWSLYSLLLVLPVLVWISIRRTIKPLY